MARLTGHGLAREGAPHDDNGQLLVYGTYVATNGEGRGKCQCGELSDWLTSGNARRAWHRDVHKPAVAQEQHTSNED